MTRVDWFNQRRLYGEITDDGGYTTPAGHKAAYYLQKHPALEPVTPEPLPNPGRFSRFVGMIGEGHVMQTPRERSQ